MPANFYFFTEKDLEVIGNYLKEFQKQNSEMGYLELQDDLVILHYFSKNKSTIAKFETRQVEGELLIKAQNKYHTPTKFINIIFQELNIGILRNCFTAGDKVEITDQQLKTIQEVLYAKTSEENPENFYKDVFGTTLYFQHSDIQLLQCMQVPKTTGFFMIWQRDLAGGGNGAIVSAEICQRILSPNLTTYHSVGKQLVSSNDTQSQKTNTKIVLSKFYFYINHTQNLGLTTSTLNSLVTQFPHMSYLRMQKMKDDLPKLFLIKHERGGYVEKPISFSIGEDKVVYVRKSASYVPIIEFATPLSGIIKNCLLDFREKLTEEPLTAEEMKKIPRIFYQLYSKPELREDIMEVMKFQIASHTACHFELTQVGENATYVLWQKHEEGGDGAILAASQLRQILQAAAKYEKKEEVKEIKIEKLQKQEEELDEDTKDFVML